MVLIKRLVSAERSSVERWFCMKRWIPAKLSATQPQVRRPSRRAALYAAAAAACLSLAAFTVPAARAVAPPASGCAAVNLIVARASTEAPGEGTIQSLAT
jgi:hypothetical protein